MNVFALTALVFLVIVYFHDGPATLDWKAFWTCFGLLVAACIIDTSDDTGDDI